MSSHKAVYDGNDVLFSICRNISSQKIAEQKIEEQNKELNMVNSEKDRFFSIIAHDLKNPISAVLGLSDLIAKSLHQKDYANAELFTGMITISAANLNTLLTNLFEWAMSCTGRIVFTPSEFNFTKLVMDVFTAHAAIFQRKEIVFEKDLPEKLTMVGDENMLRTVLTNLVSNALKFTNKGGKIIVSAKWLANELKVIVSDNGVGISEKIIPNLFKLDKNVSTYGTNQEKGTGMGIILCKEFIEKHGGRIWVESTVGKGSDFFFTIPNQNN